MVTSEPELKQDVRQMTGYTSLMALSEDGLDTAYRRAKRHIRVRKSLDSDFEWFDSENPAGEEALFWNTCLFVKVQVGDLDSQALQVGAIDSKALLAKEDDKVTEWYRNAETALESLKSDTIFQSTSPSRKERTYEPGSFTDQESGGSSVDSSDL